MLGFSFIHAADIHLGRTLSGLSDYVYDESIKKLYKTAVEKAFNNLTDFAINNNVDFVLIAGDTFDDTEQDFEAKLILKNALKRLENAEVKVFLICGNHDCLSSYNKNTFNFDENSIIKIAGLNSENNAEFLIKDKSGNDTALLHAISYEKEIFKENPVKYLTPAKKGLFNIGLIHCDMDGANDSPYGTCTYSELAELNYDYFALGHIHIPSKTGNTICYSGTIQGRNPKETGAHGIKYIKVEKGSIIENSFVPIDVIRYENLEIDITPAQDVTQVPNIITDEIEKKFKDDKCELYLVKLQLAGLVKFSNELNEEFNETVIDRIKSDFNNKIIISEVINNTNIKYDEKLLQSDEGMAGKIFEVINNFDKVQKIIQNTEKELEKLIQKCDLSEEEKQILNDEIQKSAVQKCKNIANSIYESEYKEN